MFYFSFFGPKIILIIEIFSYQLNVNFFLRQPLSVCMLCTMKKNGTLRSSYSLNHNTSTWCLQLILIAFLSMRKINSFGSQNCCLFSSIYIFPILFLLSLDRQIIIWTKNTQKRKNFWTGLNFRNYLRSRKALLNRLANINWMTNFSQHCLLIFLYYDFHLKNLLKNFSGIFFLNLFSCFFPYDEAWLISYRVHSFAHNTSWNN